MEEIHPKMEFEGKDLLPSFSCWEALFRTKSMQTVVALQRFRAPKKASKTGSTNPSEKKYLLHILSSCFILQFSRLFYILINAYTCTNAMFQPFAK